MADKDGGCDGGGVMPKRFAKAGPVVAGYHDFVRVGGCASGTDGNRSAVLVMYPDGRLVVGLPDGREIWDNGVSGYDGAELDMQDDGNLVVYTTGHAARWASRG